jgi:hypothetical protein
MFRDKNMMRSWITVGLVVGVVLGSAVCARAQMQVQPQDQDNSLLNSAVQSHWLRLVIDGGRLSLEGSRLGNFQQTTNNGPRGKEELSVRNDGGSPALTYERTNASERLMIEISESDRVRIIRTPKANSEVLPIEFLQSPNENITLTIGAADKQATFHAASLWHLMISHPQECAQYLIPCLELLQHDWHLADTVAKVEDKLVSGADGSAAATRTRWAALVEQLGDNRYAKREAADRTLRMADPTVLGYLRQLDTRCLDAEQQFRVRRIIAALSSQLSDESPDQVAMSLSEDPEIWLALLSRPDAAKRQVAARQLSAILGESIPVDPHADPVSQQSQLRQLQTRIENR